MAGKKQIYIWWVKHPDHTTAVVIAESWEQATMEAAKWWEVPWGKVVALCEEEKREALARGMCCDCGSKMWSPDGPRARCAICEAKARDREAKMKAMPGWKYTLLRAR